MWVKLKNQWFAPLDAKPHGDKRDISGGRFRPSPDGRPIEIPDYLREFLPKTAVVVDGPDGSAVEPAKTPTKQDLVQEELDAAAALQRRHEAFQQELSAASRDTAEEEPAKRRPGRPRKVSE